MRKIMLPYLNSIVSKGRTYHYYRRNSQNIRLTGSYGSPAFLESYNQIHAEFEAPQKPGASRHIVPGSLADLINKYQASRKFLTRSENTQKDYRHHMNYLAEQFGALPVKTMPHAFVTQLHENLGETPRKANYVVQIFGVLMKHARRLGWREDNPAAGVELYEGGDGHRPWEEGEIAAFREYWKLGTFERTAFELAINTGQRGGDITKMRRGDISADGRIHVRQEKTDEKVWIPISLDLREALGAWFEHQDAMVEHRSKRKKPLPVDEILEMILTGDRGMKVTRDNFRHRMIDAYKVVMMPSGKSLEGVTTHGLRYTTVTVLKELGCENETIASITGHQTVAMVEKYNEKKRLAQLAVAAMNDASAQRKRSAASTKVQNRSLP